MYDAAVLKVGGSIITDRTSDDPQIDLDAMQRTAAEIATFDDDLVLVHGAGSFGHPLVAERDIASGITADRDRLDLAWIQRLQNELNATYCEVLQEEGVPAFPVQPSAAAVMADGAIDIFETAAVSRLLEQGMVPVLFGVPAVDRERDVAILSGDLTAPAVGADIGADIVLHATDVDGVYEGDPDDSGNGLIENLTDPGEVTFVDGDRPDISGRMEGKVRELFDHDARGRIFSGEREGKIRRALQGEPVGTLVDPP